MNDLIKNKQNKINLQFDNHLIKNNKLLKNRLIEIPKSSGCYLFKDENGEILYIGKSKTLRNRVNSYFSNFRELSPRLSLMVRQITEIEIIITDSENEALNLESNLIKRNKPYFNILLKDDKKYPYICITWSEEYPRIYITRRRRYRNKRDRYYGPYVDVGLLRKTLVLVKKIFPIRQRPRPVYSDRTCLNYSIGRCPGVCQKIISPDDYSKIIKRIAMIFQGRNDELKDILSSQMMKYSDQLDFEKAALIRDQINGIDSLIESQKMTIPDSSVNRDIFAIISDNKISSIQIFQMRSGKLIGRIAYSQNNNDDEPTNLQRILEEHYINVDKVEIPSEILVQYELNTKDVIQSWLSERRGRKVNIITPKRQDKYDLIELVKKNANLELERLKKGHEESQLAIEDLTQILELSQYLKRIEGYDISHIQGTDAVASQVVFIDGIPAKQHYRK